MAATLRNIAKAIPFATLVYRSYRSLLGNVRCAIQFWRFQKLSLNTNRGFCIKWRDRWFLYNDANRSLPIEPHYTYHPAWAARILAKTKPRKHVDVSSVLHFATILSAFVEVEYYEYRPPILNGLDRLKVHAGDLCRLPFPDASVESISCMHTVEHVGLARYGDKLDPDGDLKAFQELKRVVSRGGSLLLVVPLGERAWIRFNADRIYSYDMILSLFPDFQLAEFSMILEDPTQGGIIRGASPAACRGQRAGCGCFWFVKNPTQNPVIPPASGTREQVGQGTPSDGK